MHACDARALRLRRHHFESDASHATPRTTAKKAGAQAKDNDKAKKGKPDSR
jgi:hypothetical protein